MARTHHPQATQVTVQPDETAIFFKEGKVAGTLPPGVPPWTAR